ncbi:MAG: FkbM family methyltransferase [Vicinamibacterales bacterium]
MKPATLDAHETRFEVGPARDLSLVSRLLKWLLSFSICTTNLGLGNAARIQLFARASAKVRAIWIPGFPKPFHFRGSADRGVMSHFFKESWCIQDTDGRPVRSIVDCGANIGDETVKLWLRYPKATIVAVEPDALNCSFLQRNVSGLDRIIVKHAGVWHRNAKLSVIAGESYEAFTVHENLSEESLQEQVPAVTIPELMEEQGWSTIDILKLDIEGADLDLFQHSSGWIHQINVIVVEANDAQRLRSTAALFEATAAEEFDAFIHGENHVLIRRGLGWTLAPRFRIA